MSWLSGKEHRTQALVILFSRVWVREPWHLCPWARHSTTFSLHQVYGYLWGQRWFLWLIKSSSTFISYTGCILPRELRWFKEWIKAQWPGVIKFEALWVALRVWKALYNNCILYSYYITWKGNNDVLTVKTPRYLWVNVLVSLSAGVSVGMSAPTQPCYVMRYFIPCILCMTSTSDIRIVLWVECPVCTLHTNLKRLNK